MISGRRRRVTVAVGLATIVSLVAALLGDDEDANGNMLSSNVSEFAAVSGSCLQSRAPDAAYAGQQVVGDVLPGPDEEQVVTGQTELGPDDPNGDPSGAAAGIDVAAVEAPTVDAAVAYDHAIRALRRERTLGLERTAASVPADSRFAVVFDSPVPYELAHSALASVLASAVEARYVVVTDADVFSGSIRLPNMSPDVVSSTILVRAESARDDAVGAPAERAMGLASSVDAIRAGQPIVTTIVGVSTMRFEVDALDNELSVPILVTVGIDGCPPPILPSLHEITAIESLGTELNR